MGRDGVFRPRIGKKPKLYGLSEYLMIMHELAKVRAAGRAQNPHQIAECFPGKYPPTKPARRFRRANAKEGAECL